MAMHREYLLNELVRNHAVDVLCGCVRTGEQADETIERVRLAHAF